MNDVEKKVLKSLRRSIDIKVSETERDDIEDGQMDVYNEDSYFDKDEEFVFGIYSILNEGIYEFHLDDRGITREVEMVDSDNQIVNFK
uniref:Uncharacterized protein n=1 Tax=Meloidogyne floridensis TaxID=298350 RepID=A0A915P0K3_9BILA